MIVVDTNVISYLLLTGDKSPDADKLFAHDNHWIAPPLWRSEFRNVLSIYLRKGIISFDEALTLSENAVMLMKENEYNVSFYDVLKLVQDSTCSAYDCEFVALADNFEIPLYTMDKKILQDFPATARSLTAVSD